MGESNATTSLMLMMLDGADLPLSLFDYPEDVKKLSLLPPEQCFVEEIALPGRDGEKADSLLQHAKKSGAQILSDLTWEAVRRYLKDWSPGLTSGIFNEEEVRQLAEEFKKVIGPADLLGRARIRLRKMHVERYSEDENTDFSSFDENRLVPMVPEQALAYFRHLIPSLNPDVRYWGPLIERESFTMTEATSVTLLKKVQNAIAKMLEPKVEQGEIVRPVPRKAVQKIDEVLNRAGVHPKNSGYSDMVFRTNLMESFRAGAQREFSDPELRDDFPCYKFIGIHDGRERHGPLPKKPDHLRWFGKYFSREIPFVTVRGTDAANVINCRCDFVPITRGRWAKLQAAGARLTPWPS